MKPYLLIFTLICLMIDISFASEIKIAVDDELITATISKREPTRISVMEDRIKNVIHKTGSFSLQENTENGDIFIIPNERLAIQTIHLFILTEKGHTYQLALNPQTTEAKSILIRPTHLSTKKAELWEKQTPLRQSVIRLMKVMLDGAVVKGINRTEAFEKIPFKEGLGLELKSRFDGAKLTGKVYQLKNNTKDTVTLKESEFYEQGALAIHAEHSMVIPGGVSKVYVIKRRPS